MTLTPQSMMACHECDLLHQVAPLPPKSGAYCVRCGALLYRQPSGTAADPVDRTLAMTLTGLVTIFIAALYPFLSLESQGITLKTTLVTGAIILSEQSAVWLGLLVFLTSLIIPLAFMLAIFFVLMGLKQGRTLPVHRRIFRWALILRPWSMTEVFVLGIFVSVIKLAKLATIIPGTALFAFLSLTFILAIINTVLEPRIIWEKFGP